MKRLARFTLWLSLALMATLLLAGCVRLLQRDEQPTVDTDTTDALPTLDPNLFPTATTAPPAGETPTDGAYPAPGTGTDTGTTDGGSTTEPGDTTTDAGGEQPAPAPTPRTTQVEHVVQAGDTVGRLAEQYGVTINQIVVANGLANPNRISVGQVLIIPPPGETGAGDDGAQAERTHIVQPGETLFRIGLAYGFTVQELVEYNGLANPDRLEVGQEIRIPPTQ